LVCLQHAKFLRYYFPFYFFIFFFFYCYCAHRHLLSFPTRRSSDLHADNERSHRAALRLGYRYEGTFRQHMVIKARNRDTHWLARSEEHTSELQSRRDLVCRLLLEKKKTSDGSASGRIDPLTEKN